ncbi:MAG: hypothetical protein ACOZAA_01585 [Pseudomonadota bacterium]
MNLDPALVAALVAGLISIVVAIITSVISVRLQESRLRTELQLEFATEAAIRQLLMNEQWELRTFEEIKRRFKGIDENELRKSLIRAGALSFDGDKGEMWGLRERNKSRLA